MRGSGGFNVAVVHNNVLRLSLLRVNIFIALTKFKSKTMHQKIAQACRLQLQDLCLCERFRGFNVAVVHNIILKLPLFREIIFIALTKFKSKTMHQKIAQSL